MHAIFISACEKKALKKTRAILDSYAIRSGPSSWQAPMTMEGMKEIRAALRKVATRQTAVAAYVNYGMRKMKLFWVVGAKHKFANDGAFPVASTQKTHKKQLIDEWVRASSLLAGAAGDMHDIGKASVHFQKKLGLQNAELRIKDAVRHEWLSIKLLQALRANGWNWSSAWKGIEKNIQELSLGDRQEIDLYNPYGVKTSDESVDYLIVTHHGLLGTAEENNPISVPNSSKHVRLESFKENQFKKAGDLDSSIFDSYKKRIQRLEKLLDEQNEKTLLYWKALSLHARAALVHADHAVSAQQYHQYLPDNIDLFANTKYKNNEQNKLVRMQDQPLIWHLQQVGDKAARVSTQMIHDLNLPGLSEQTVEYICQTTRNKRFDWQNIVANALQKQLQKTPDSPCLILNIAGTGSGKTRMNLRAACTLRATDPRIAIALNLRSLTLQTGDALKTSMNLSDEEIAVIIGDSVTQRLFNLVKENYIDEDENVAEPIFDSFGEEVQLPQWLSSLYDNDNFSKNNNKDKTVLASPLLVSTIDYLIAAGEPYKQGHHVKALLRIISSDLILDEIDSYEPKALIAVLRLVQLAAMYGRNVICSSATLSLTVAKIIHRAFESGIHMRSALYEKPLNSIVAIIDNELKPEIFLDETNKSSLFNLKYEAHLKNLQTHLRTKKTHRLAQLIPVNEYTTFAWKTAVLASAKQLHIDNSWTYSDTGKKISFGLIRVANIKHAVAVSQFIADQWPEAKVACYHANDWLISRFYKEKRLDELLTRHIDNKKRKTGNEHIEQDVEIRELVSSSAGNDIPFVVVATPVEEVGRDHDFDWAIIDASSVQSIVQTAGRVNRHRLMEVSKPNIMIPQWNYRYCSSQEKAQKAGKSRQRVKSFIFPGYESYSSNSLKNLYSTQNLLDLLPWENNQLIINADLRFNQERCMFAKLDDQQIQSFCKNYFNDEGEQLFSNSDVKACLMGEQIYKKTPLRENQLQDIYRFELEDGDIRISKQVYGLDIDATNNPNFSKYGLTFQKSHFNLIEAKSQSWLSLTPTEMHEVCGQYNIDPKLGCKVALPIYNQDKPVQWSYDLGFGIFVE